MGQSRVEEILENMLGEDDPVTPQSRVEELLVQIAGGGDSSNSNVDTIIENGNIQFFSKGGNG